MLATCILQDVENPLHTQRTSKTAETLELLLGHIRETIYENNHLPLMTLVYSQSFHQVTIQAEQACAIFPIPFDTAILGQLTDCIIMSVGNPLKSLEVGQAVLLSGF